MTSAMHTPFPPDPIHVADALASAPLAGTGTLAQQVYVLLRKLVVDLTLMPNQFLSEKDVADGLRISKTPVREAFIRLAEDDIVNIMPKSGTYVSVIDMNRLNEGFFICRALCSSCAARLAGASSLRDIDSLRNLIASRKQVLEQNEYSKSQAVIIQFHSAIVALADFPSAQKLLESATFEIDRIGNMLRMHTLHAFGDAVAELTEIVNAIAIHDERQAKRLVSAHIDKMNAFINDLTRNRDFWEHLDYMNRKRTGKRRQKGNGAKQ